MREANGTAKRVIDAELQLREKQEDAAKVEMNHRTNAKRLHG